MSRSAVGLMRLSGQRLAGRGFDSPAAVVRWMAAMQAQDYGQSLWAIGVRLRSGSLAAVEQAIAAGEILRTWPMRGTIHFVPPEDAGWMVGLSRDRMLRSARRRLAELDLDAVTLNRSKELLYQALRGGRRLTRPELMALLQRSGISPAGQRGYHVIYHAAQTGLICIGPRAGRQQTFVLLAEWAPNARELGREEAIATLAGRYAASHGPVTARDFAWWAGLTLTDAREALRCAAPALVTETIDGVDYWLPDPPPAPARRPHCALLAGFDEFLLGYTDRSQVLAPDHSNAVVPGNNGVFRPGLEVNGAVIGTWRGTTLRTGLEVTLTPIEALSESTLIRARTAARRYARFVGEPLAGLAVAPPAR